MKRAVIIFTVLLLLTLLVPLCAVAEHQKNSTTEELVTLFSSDAAVSLSTLSMNSLPDSTLPSAR